MNIADSIKGARGITFTGSSAGGGSSQPFNQGPPATPFDVRWNATDNRIEKSIDGGATWTTVVQCVAYDV